MSTRFPSIDLAQLPLVVDASVMINLLGTGSPGTLLKGHGLPVLMVEEAFAEVKRHPISGHDAAPDLAQLIAEGVLEILPLGDMARRTFHDLTANDLTGGLDDGEAATIALAIAHSAHAVPVIDEKKAARLFAGQWAQRILISSITLLAQPQVRCQLDESDFADALFSALRHARMRIPIEARSWVRGVIGSDRAAQCSCLGPVSAQAAGRSLAPRSA
jgi:predicted nucleic acid-binding protein